MIVAQKRRGTVEVWETLGEGLPLSGCKFLGPQALCATGKGASSSPRAAFGQRGTGVGCWE